MLTASPRLYFNPHHYLGHNPELFAAGINTGQDAWDHYVHYGAAESLTGIGGRAPVPWFDAAFYLAQYPDLASAGLAPADLFAHFTTWGIAEGRVPAAGFGVTPVQLAAYAAANPDLMQAFSILDPQQLGPMQLESLARHLYQYGYAEGRPADPFGLAMTAPESPGGPAPGPGIPEAGQVFTLTAQIETLQGTEGDDVFLAPTVWTGQAQIETLQPGDVIHGGAGFDALAVESLGGVMVVRADGVEQLKVTAHYPAIVEAAYARGLEHVTVEQSAGGVTLRHLENLVTLTVCDQVAVRDWPLDVNDVSLGYGIGALAGDSEQFITLDHVRFKEGGAHLYFDALGEERLEALDFTVVGASDLAGIAGLPDPLTGQSSAVLDDVALVRVHALAAADLGVLALPGLVCLDASDSLAGVRVDLSSTQADALQIKGGAGDDVFILAPSDHPQQQVLLSFGGGHDTVMLQGLDLESAQVVVLAGQAYDDSAALDAVLAALVPSAGPVLAVWQDSAGQVKFGYDAEGAMDQGGVALRILGSLRDLALDEVPTALDAGYLAFA